MMLVPCEVTALRVRNEELVKALEWMTLERDQWRALATTSTSIASIVIDTSETVLAAALAPDNPPIPKARHALGRALRAPATQTIGLFVV